MPRYPHIEEYRRRLEETVRVGGSLNESSIRDAFKECLRKYCEQAGLSFIPELPHRSGVIPDGTVKNELRLTHGYYEAKDLKDDLHREIAAKFKKGYPNDNILFENSRAAVLIQNNREAMRVDDMGANFDGLDSLIRAFVNYSPPEVISYRRAVKGFSEDLPAILQTLRTTIDRARVNNSAFIKEADNFLALCRETINPEVGEADIREMLIQHILTHRIFTRIFDDDQFHAENNIARRLDALRRTCFTREVRRTTLDRIKTYYAVIERAAQGIVGHREKQRFLKAIYENFYRIYNPKAADRLGVIYTPSEIVEFMVRAADQLTDKHFSRRLWNKGVQILDPAAGTGTFVTELIEYFPRAHVREKYLSELHANEVGILPYYIANLNIEYTYAAKTGKYDEFPGICFVDTLDNLGFKSNGQGQGTFYGAWSKENVERIRRQNKRDISVIIGNPPYNASQKSENENNKNREYPEVDRRLKETYIAGSKAQKTKLYDPYVRFIRWASDRLGENGVLSFVTNSSFIHARGYDGFRARIAKEFNEIIILDLKGNLRDDSSPEGKKEQGGNVFGVKVGIAVWLFVRKKGKRGCSIHYFPAPGDMTGEDKLALLVGKDLDDFDFWRVTPDAKHNWINQAENGFDSMLPMVDKKTKEMKSWMSARAIFPFFTNGVSTNRDAWVYDFDDANLSAKVRFFIAEWKRLLAEKTCGNFPSTIKWSRDLKNQFVRRRAIKYNSGLILNAVYRPFTVKRYYADFVISDRLAKPHQKIFGKDLNRPNKVICFNARRKEFHLLATDKLADLHFTGDSQCFPLHQYDAYGERLTNITQWGLQQFRKHYSDDKITAEDVFHYTYGVLHNPIYREKYRMNLMREFPRLPFYSNFPKWAKWGKRLMDLHINFESADPFALTRRDQKVASPAPRLKADKLRSAIIVDEATSLHEIPAEAWEYKLGGRSALEWVLDQHKEKAIKDPTIAERFNNYRFADHKERVIDLLHRVCTVSVETMKIINQMKAENS